ncbi:MAG: MATE family efflux transporter [Ignavibacteriales bacterium]|nr:MATE family efflux transporter [Ignavibacteriales bacterium]
MIKEKLISLFQFEGKSRGGKAKRNIVLLFGLHIFNFIFTLVIVRLTLDYLGETDFGIWSVLNSILMWAVYLDFGLGNGLRNKLAEEFAHSNKTLAKVYVSTAYAIFSIAIFIVFIIFLVVFQWINWIAIFNAPIQLSDTIDKLVFYVFTFFAIQFVLKLITSIILADQKPAINGLFTFFINLLTIILVIILQKVTSSSLLLLGVGFSLIPIIVFGLANLYFFRKNYKEFAPSIKFVKWEYSKHITSLGFKFFVIQIATLIILATDNLIITQILGPESVSVYQVAFRYFSMVPLAFGIILTPMWSAYTEAYVKEDFVWIKNAIRKIIYIWFFLIFATFLMVLFSDFVYSLMTKDKFTIPFLLTISLAIYTVLNNWNNIFAYFINGVGKISLSFYFAIFTAIVKIPLSIYFALNLNLGISGVILATSACLIIGAIWTPIQLKKILNKTDKGIWGR